MFTFLTTFTTWLLEMFNYTAARVVFLLNGPALAPAQPPSSRPLAGCTLTPKHHPP